MGHAPCYARTCAPTSGAGEQRLVPAVSVRGLFFGVACLLGACLMGACGEQASSSPPVCASDPTRSCLEGAAFVACTGRARSNAPAVLCSSGEAGRCVWISDGCPFGDYLHRVGPDCACTADSCPPVGTIASFAYGFGPEPWTRETPALDVTVTVDAQANATSSDAISCSGAGATDCSKSMLCCETTPAPGAGPVVRQTSKALRDTLALSIQPRQAFAGWRLLIEVDGIAGSSGGGAGPRARICRLPFTDSVHCGDIGAERECAGSGTLTLSDGAPTEKTLADVRGTFSVIFPSGLEIVGSFH